MEEPDGGPAPRRRRSRYWWLVGLAIAALIVIVLAPLASTDPDGLQRVAKDNGFLEAARNALYSIIPHYNVPGVQGNLSTILGGLIGIVIVFAVMVVVGRILVRRRR